MSEDRPLLRVVRGDPTPDELAALLAVVAARAGGAGAGPSRRRPLWNAPQRLVREPVVAGPGAWRASGLPR